MFIQVVNEEDGKGSIINIDKIRIISPLPGKSGTFIEFDEDHYLKIVDSYEGFSKMIWRIEQEKQDRL